MMSLWQNVSELQLKGARWDLGSVVQSQHGVPYHQGSAEEIQDSRGWGTRERGGWDLVQRLTRMTPCYTLAIMSHCQH